jgi:hypothetical protein
MNEGTLSVEALLTFANTVLLAAKAVIGDDDVVRRLQDRVLAMLPRLPESSTSDAIDRVELAAGGGELRLPEETMP